MKKYTTADLFSGIGGIRLGFEKTGRTFNTLSVEWDKYACETYQYNFNENPQGDVTKLNVDTIPDFDILLAGIPCQAFSIAGKRKGFDDIRGTLFFDVARVIAAKRPSAFLIENVKGLIGHNKGNTLSVMLDILNKDLGYKTTVKVYNAKDYGLAQNRERVYIIGFKDKEAKFVMPEYKGKFQTIRDIIEKTEVSNKYYLSQTYLQTLKRHRERHENRGNGFGYEILDYDGIANAIVVGGMGKERNLIIDKRLTNFDPVTNKKGGINNEFIRSLTPREWARLQGFPDDFKIPVSDTQAYKQFGNSVPVNVIYYIAQGIITALDNLKKESNYTCLLKTL